MNKKICLKNFTKYELEQMRNDFIQYYIESEKIKARLISEGILKIENGHLVEVTKKDY